MKLDATLTASSSHASSSFADSHLAAAAGATAKQIPALPMIHVSSGFPAKVEHFTFSTPKPIILEPMSLDFSTFKLHVVEAVSGKILI